MTSMTQPNIHIAIVLASYRTSCVLGSDWLARGTYRSVVSCGIKECVAFIAFRVIVTITNIVNE